MSTTETFVIAAIVMDRSGPLGNSLDVFGRRALHTKIGNKPSEAIPVYLTDPGNNQDPFFAQSEDVTDPGVEKEILTGTLALDSLFSILNVTCRIESKIILTVNDEFVASLRTGAAKPNASFQWEPKRPFPAGATFKVTIKARAGSPISDCEAHLMGLQTTP